MRQVFTKIIPTVCVIALCSCNSPLLNKDALGDSLAKGLDKSVTKLDTTVNRVSNDTLEYLKSLNLGDLTAKIGSSVDSSGRTVESIGRLSDSLKENSDGIKLLVEKIKDAVDPAEIKRLGAQLNETVKRFNQLLETTSNQVPILSEDLHKILANINLTIGHIKDITGQLARPSEQTVPGWAYIGGTILAIFTTLGVFLMIKKGLKK